MTHPVHYHSENYTKKPCTLFKTIPLCECCERKPAVSFSLLENGWFFTCECTSKDERYFIYLEDFFADPTSVVCWLAQLRPKPWMDWNAFAHMVMRLRQVI